MIVPSRLLSLSTHNESLKIHIFLNKYLKYSKIWSLTVSRLFQLLVIVSESVFLVLVRSPNNIFNKHVCSCYLKSFKTKKHYFDPSYSAAILVQSILLSLLHKYSFTRYTMRYTMFTRYTMFARYTMFTRYTMFAILTFSLHNLIQRLSFFRVDETFAWEKRMNTPSRTIRLNHNFKEIRLCSKERLK